MQNTNVKTLLSQLRGAADAIKAQIHEADKQIEALNKERRALADAPVSKADFMEYIRADIGRRAAGYPIRLKQWARKTNFPPSFVQLERTHTQEGLHMFPYLDGEAPYNGPIVEFEPRALYWHFGELIAERFSAALDVLQWPADAVSVAERRTRIAKIDAQIQELETRRDGLAKDLMDSGMYE